MLLVSMSHSEIRFPREEYVSLAREVQGMAEANEDEAIKKAMLSWILKNPVDYLRLLPKNFSIFGGRLTVIE